MAHIKYINHSDSVAATPVTKASNNYCWMILVGVVCAMHLAPCAHAQGEFTDEGYSAFGFSGGIFAVSQSTRDYGEFLYAASFGASGNSKVDIGMSYSKLSGVDEGAIAATGTFHLPVDTVGPLGAALFVSYAVQQADLGVGVILYGEFKESARLRIVPRLDIGIYGLRAMVGRKQSDTQMGFGAGFSIVSGSISSPILVITPQIAKVTGGPLVFGVSFGVLFVQKNRAGI